VLNARTAIALYVTPSKSQPAVAQGPGLSHAAWSRTAPQARQPDGALHRDRHGQGHPVSYTGILPDLFKEGKARLQGLGPDGKFTASEVLAKRDELHAAGRNTRSIRPKPKEPQNHDS
jgi:cytochrome c-type biogenesis protein CcmE